MLLHTVVGLIWIDQFDPYNNVTVSIPPSTQILAQFAFSDRISEPWFATAGLNRGVLTQATDLVNPPSLGERELMYGQGNAVNPIAKFVQEGIVIWGQKTLIRQESALNRITVRRMLNFAKVTIGLAAKVILFEPNDPSSITRLINLINPVLADIARRRGITKFEVRDVTTDRDRALNRVRINIFLEPTSTIEVIEIPFIVTSAGGSFAI
jgi:phage tail sheath protein FI